MQAQKFAFIVWALVAWVDPLAAASAVAGIEVAQAPQKMVFGPNGEPVPAPTVPPKVWGPNGEPVVPPPSPAPPSGPPKIWGPNGEPIVPPPSLEQRIAELEARIARLEAEKTVLKAPLVVYGAGGKPILRLSADGFLTLGVEGGATVGLVAQPGSPARIGVQNGTSAVQMSATSGVAKLEVFNGETESVNLLASAAELGVVVEKGGKPAAGLGSVPGKSVALRLYDKGGKTVAAAGENPNTPGTGIVYVGNGSKNGAALAANGDGSGVVHAFATDGTVGSGLIGVDRMVAAYNAAGNAVVTIGKSENSEGGNVTSRDPTGEGVFRAGYNSAVGGGDACVFRAKRQTTFCLGLGIPGVGTR